MGQPLLQHELSFTSVDYMTSNSDYHPLESIPEGVTINFRDPMQNVPKKNHIRYCKALYDFGGKNSSELTFKAGDVIKVLRTKTPSGGDDGWWEGEVHDRVGLFPSLVVEPVVDVSRQGFGSPFRMTSNSQFQDPKLEIVEFGAIGDIGLSKVRHDTFHEFLSTLLSSASVSTEDISEPISSVHEELASQISSYSEEV